LLCGWDVAHRLELCVGDCREDKDGQDTELQTIAWYADMEVEMNKLLARFQWGKGFESLLAVGKETNRKVYNPQLHCKTRFAQGQRKVIQSFSHNYPLLLLDVARKVAACGSSRSKPALSLYADFDQLRCLPFVVRTFAMVDMLRMVKDHSLAVQKVNVLPWEIKWHCDHFQKKVAAIVDTLNIPEHEDFDPSKLTEHFPFLLEHAQSIMSSGMVEIGEY
jgi:hypothetical protein